MAITRAKADPAENVTAALAMRLSGLSWSQVNPHALTVAKQCLLDWIGVCLAARDEPLVGMLLGEFDSVGAHTILGASRRARLLDAVLINAAQSHALDFDDVIIVMGHPSVPVAPVVLALAEAYGSTGRDALLAFITGVEIECRIGRLMGPSHYARGWHGTATFGTFGAMAAAAKLMGLEGEPLLHAFGLAGTQAAGLKSVFGSMSKPLHAGKAAQNGLLAAKLAARGFTSDTRILDSDQGFAAVQSSSPAPDAALADLPEGLHVTNALFKYHAACFLTHDTIEAAAALKAEHRFEPDEIAAVRVHVGPAHMGVCNIPEPRTGLECKFSLRMAAALALTGEDTFQERLFSDATANRQDLVALRGRVSVCPDVEGAGSVVEIDLKNGRSYERRFDVSKPLRDLKAQQGKIEHKFRHLAEPVVGAAAAEEIIENCSRLEDAPDLHAVLASCARQAA